MSGLKNNKRASTCHPERPHLARGLCSSCYYKEPDQKKRRATSHNLWAAKNKDKVKKYAQNVYKKHRVRILAENKVRRQWKLYEITQGQYDKMFKQQNGVCTICFRPPNRQGLNIDHDHVTNRVRGLLCWYCNKYIVCGPNTPELLERAAAYLRSEFDGREL